MFHPMSRPSSLRDTPGCLTPTNFEPTLPYSPKAPHGGKHEPSCTTMHASARAAAAAAADVAATQNLSILSPPPSPYQRAAIDTEDVPALEIVAKVYIPLKQPFKIENFKRYQLQVNPWTNLNHLYRQKQINFLEQYAVISTKEVQSSKKPALRKRLGVLDSDSEFERVRTRRTVRESPAESSDAAPAKRRKTAAKPREPPALASQQAALIDESIADYLPDAAATLPRGNTRCLKVEWKGQQMDLRNDPNIGKLHPAEAVLASILRLPGNVYLDSKRRLFFEKVTRLKRGQQFRRTDAQKACRIDVNKASRLFAAFEKVGWLDDDHFVKYL